jgi:hypothetical protein
MSEGRFRVSGELFKRILTHMDTLSRKQLMELQNEGRGVEPGICSPAFYHMVLALEDLAKVELVNRDLMGDQGLDSSLEHV